MLEDTKGGHQKLQIEEGEKIQWQKEKQFLLPM
jgi:hypothetical protein